MGVENIVNRIISDAEAEADTLIKQANSTAENTVGQARKKAERNMQGTIAETAQKVKAILDGKAATARLDCAKIELAEKRRVIDCVYVSALKKLNALEKPASLALAERLLKAYAEEGDEIVFSAGYKYVSDVVKLDVVKELKLTFSQSDRTTGGFTLKGAKADKDVSYTALLNADREENVSFVASKLFN